MNIWRHSVGRESLYRTSVSKLERGPDCAICPVRDHSLCLGLEPHELPRIAEKTTVLHGGAGEILFFEGDRAQHFFTLREGVIRLVRAFPDGRRSIVGFLHGGDFLGGSFGAGDYPVTAEAVTRIEYCRIAVGDLKELTNEFPALDQRLLTMSANRMQAAQDHIVLLSRKTAVEKVAAFLCASREWAGGADEFELPMSRTDIADYLGLTIETVSRVLTKLVESRAIGLRDARHITIKDYRELKVVAQPEAMSLDC